MNVNDLILLKYHDIFLIFVLIYLIFHFVLLLIYKFFLNQMEYIQKLNKHFHNLHNNQCNLLYFHVEIFEEKEKYFFQLI